MGTMGAGSKGGGGIVIYHFDIFFNILAVQSTPGMSVLLGVQSTIPVYFPSNLWGPYGVVIFIL